MLPSYRTFASGWRLFGCCLMPVIYLMVLHQSLVFDTFSSVADVSSSQPSAASSVCSLVSCKPVPDVASCLVVVLAQADEAPESVSDPGPVVPIA